MPTPNSGPRDPAVAPDGSLWYTGQAANELGRLDPATGRFEEFPLQTPDSGPHGLVADLEGLGVGAACSPREREVPLDGGLLAHLRGGRQAFSIHMGRSGAVDQGSPVTNPVDEG